MWEFLEALQNSSFSVWVRESDTLAYSTILALHTFGMSFLVGLSTMIALRVLGFAASQPLAPNEKVFRADSDRILGQCRHRRGAAHPCA